MYIYMYIHCLGSLLINVFMYGCTRTTGSAGDVGEVGQVGETVQAAHINYTK